MESEQFLSIPDVSGLVFTENEAVAIHEYAKTDNRASMRVCSGTELYHHSFEGNSNYKQSFRRDTMSYQCKKCGSAVPEDARFCSNCGEKVTALRCPNCGKRLPEDSAFCTYCGAKIAAEQAVPSAPQPKPTVPETMVEPFANLVASPEQEQPAAPANAAAGISTAASEESQTPNTSHQEARAAKAFESHSTVNTSDNDIDEASGSQHHYHLTRRKLKLNVRGISSAFEETDLNVNDCTVVISDHLLKKDEPVLTQFLIPDLRQIFVGRTISVPWLCSALLFTILLLAYLVSDVRTMGARASGLLIICVVMSWIMAWYRTITFCFKDGKKIVIRGREKDVMLGLKQDLLSRIEAEPDYTGDLSDVIIKNTQYYLPEFEKARRNEKCRFNWAAFFFNGIFAYYRKSQEIFWHYYKWPFIIYAVIVLGISGSGFLAFKTDAGLAAWMVAVTILSVAINIYLLVTNIRFGKNFNKEYYQHCMVRAESSEITPRTAGTSAKNAILYWIVMSLCVGLIAGIAGALVSTAFIGGLPDDAWDGNSGYDVAELTKSDIAGRWELMYYEDTEDIISRDTLVDAGITEEVIDDYFSGNYIIFQEDGFCEFHSYDAESKDTSYAAWVLNDGTLNVIDSDSNSVFSSVQIDEGILCLQIDDQLAKYVKVSDDPVAPASESENETKNGTTDYVEPNSDRSTWDYDDYVAYYGFDPADYGYEWYNEIRNGPLDDFFEMVSQEISRTENDSRLYTITDPYSATLTPDDFIGRWVTEGGIVFTIEYYNGEYSIDFTENNNLSILGGWFSENTYNIEGAFSGMAGATGVTSFSVSYEYGTDYPTHTWLTLDITESDGNEIIDYVLLT